MSETKDMKSERVKPKDMITATHVHKEKAEYESTPAGWVKVICIKSYTGMLDVIYEDEVFLLPERRYKSLMKDGFVKPYFGPKKAINKR